MDILFKPRVEATEQMAQNCMDISLSKNQRERKITSVAKNREVLCKQYTSTEKNIESPKILWLFENFSDCSHYPC